ncbi:MAG: RNA polymerase sporulation sigma factor SigG [Bacilli bacterium]|nr:RNA polymerase sporulation sigma factor SigG [Bacilli bacterium]
MRNKVEITGVNTQDLKVLTSSESLKLLKKYQEGNLEARTLLIEGNLKLVLSVIKKFNYKSENLDDLFQVGCMGLIKAIDNFDLSHGVMFSTYAVPMIIGEIRRYLRDNSKIRISRSLKDIAYKTLQFKEKYIQTNFKEPTIEEISKALEIPVEDIVIALEAIQEPVSIYTPIYTNGNDEIYLLDQIPDGEYNENDRINKMIIEEGIKRLNPRLKNIIYDRYYNNKTQMEIASEIGISQAQVSRLEKSALKIIFEEK